MLKIARNLTLPLDFVTERIAFLARTGAGKSGGMRVLAEEMIEAGQFVVQLDLRAGDMWGIRASGAKSGYPVIVMGGEHADVPLQPTAGKFVADFLVKERVSTVLDVSDFTKADATRFVTAFADRFYMTNRDVVHLFIDEVDVVAGEKNYDPHCLEAIQYLQTKGRKRGIGVTISTQRTAMTNKTVLSQAGTLIAMQQVAPRDLKAVREYLDAVAEPDIVKQINGALPTLKTREAFVYSPQFLGAEPKRITFNSFHTFDSMRTPRPGEVRQKPKKLADIDLSAVQRDMAATIEEAKANDPAELKRQLAESKRELKALENRKPALVKPEPQGPRLKSAIEDRNWWRDHANSMVKELNDLRKRMEAIQQAVAYKPKVDITKTRVDFDAALNGHAKKTLPVTPTKFERPIQKPLVQKVTKTVEATGDLTKTQQRILDTIATLDARGIQANRDSVARWQAIHPNGGRYGSDLAALRAGGYLEGFRLTDSGSAAASVQTTGPDAVIAALPDGTKQKLFRTILEGDSPFSREELAAELGIHPNGGRYGSDLAWLRTMQVITDRGPIEVTPGAVQ